ncbi:YabP family protein [Paraliobacillus sp. PM-2]|uniref:sporulation protein YqfC n=1 Tax=Paraliobacillus sp. PM-2 TaxID=1462524 RepID=UPI00061CAAD1|nr:sporulation protein YqfC [Paraliobacillus sp. PM-2]CQR46885.1 YabP family protein [Paraliobacillus sp. PM-2]
MNKWQQRLGNWLTNHLKLPSDIVLELPRITTIGQFHAYIENHRGLITFKDEEIQLKMTKGILQITGNNFVIKTLLPEEILIEGTISAIRFINETNEQ